jgi:polynucleotide 5'-kinase involved in rRNA processing
MTNEVLAPSQPSTEGAASQLREALQLSRLTLFDQDVWVMGHALTARRRVLASMWKHAQPRAVLALSTEALKSHLKEGISKRAGGRWFGDCDHTLLIFLFL